LRFIWCGGEDKNMIDRYDFGKIKIDGKEYNHDVIIYPEEIKDWWRKESHRVDIEDVKEIIEKKPKTIIFGTGESEIMKVPEETKKFLEASSIKVIIESTKKACEIYNKLFEKEDIVAALHLTC
jgi:hypothetical protein